MPAKTTGRPSKLTPKTHTALVTALTSGCYRETAAKVAGIGVSTLYRWLEQGEADIEHNRTTPYRELREAIEKAEADAEKKLLDTIQAAAPKNWQAAAWMLERKNPDRWGRRDAMKLEHSGRIRTETVVEVTPEDDRRRQVAELLNAQGALNGHGRS